MYFPKISKKIGDILRKGNKKSVARRVALHKRLIILNRINNYINAYLISLKTVDNQITCASQFALVGVATV